MSWIRIWVHLVFSTKDREPFLHNNQVRYKVFEHIKLNAEKKNIWLDCINGYHEHAHCLISLGKDQSISQLAQLIKGESSYWINQNNLTVGKFSWQDDYWAVSISESHVPSVRDYIHAQENHHKTKNFLTETNDFMDKYGWTRLKD